MIAIFTPKPAIKSKITSMSSSSNLISFQSYTDVELKCLSLVYEVYMEQDHCVQKHEQKGGNKGRSNYPPRDTIVTMYITKVMW